MDASKASKLGVPKGPLLGKLVKGETIVLPSGATVSPEDCVGAPLPGPILLIISCPTEAHVSDVTSSPSFAPYFETKASSSSDMRVVVVHLTPSHLASLPMYIDWMSKFGKSANHLMCHAPPHDKSSSSSSAKESDAAPSVTSAYKSFLELQVQLHHVVHSGMFPLPFQDASPETYPHHAHYREISGKFGKNVVFGEPLLKFNIQPMTSMGIDRSEVITPTILPKMEAPSYSVDVSSDDELVFLGVGAAIPFKTRNVSGQYLRLASSSSSSSSNQNQNQDNVGILVDAGESTYGQLYRKYGPERLPHILINLSAVVLTHRHADHHLGIVTILCKRHQHILATHGDVAPLVIFCSRFIQGYFQEFSTFMDFGTLEFHHLSELLASSPTLPKWDIYFQERIPDRTITLRSVMVEHCYDAWGVIISSSSSSSSSSPYSWKVVFSGDTRPCDALAEAGKDATILIHEATMEDNLQHEAEGRGHSTTSEVLRMCTRMNAHRVVLTHFSQRHRRYPLADFLIEEGDNISRSATSTTTTTTIENQYRDHNAYRLSRDKAVVAFDLMTLSLNKTVLSQELPAAMTSLCKMAKLE
eukprot:TRINITY_DN12175_c0_g1_i12.p1 TRINITY_DN12175_c0_g1~~TRINITY_DN12175_c0_g1_i12.p1  ORF type:complete len:586 (+),score=99.66 TRINITY_DN12175_c0_g1_i12:915-2672(+)